MPERYGFPMAVTTGKTLGNRTGTWRAFRPVYVQHTSPCREACPAGEDIARWIDLLRARQYRQAWEILTEENPFPATMGRICIHPCQSQCNRGHHDEALGINAMEQFLGDRALQEGWAFPPPAQERGERVAVVGGGPAGLSCAYQLRRMGYPVTLFEAGDRLGGHLTSALPDYQLPPRIVAAEIQRILDLGVEVRLGVRVGEAMAWAELREQYQAVFLAVGAPQILGPGVPGEELQGVYNGLALLREVKAGRRSAPGRQAVVIGAGLTGIEAARTLLRIGAVVTIVTAEAEESLMLPDRMHEALAEGAALICGAEVQAILGGEAVTGVRLRDRELPADTVVLATGRMVDLECLPEDAEVDGAFHVAADPFTGQTRMGAVFAGGDVTGTRYAVEAVGAGKKAAAAIHAYLQGHGDLVAAMAGSRLGYSPNLSMRYYLRPESYPPQVRVKLQRVITYEDIEALYFPPQARVHREWRAPAERLGSFAEARLGLTEAQAVAESRRCFNCGTCIGCDNCLIFCPDMAISKTADGSGFAVNWDYCKGCGACVQECPREALVLEEEIK